MRRLIAVTAAIGLGVTGLATAGTASAGTTAAASTAAVPVTASSIGWGTCADPGLTDSGAVCGTLAVPLDYNHPNGTKITLALSMVRHTAPDSKYQGIMLVNPGGPGGSGLGLSTLGQYVPNGAGDDYDWIGWDPRGVGSSTPSLSCDPNYFQGPRPNYTPSTAALTSFWLAKSKAYAKACGAGRRRAARPRHHGRLGQGHGEHPQGDGAVADQLLRLLLRHLPRLGLRHPVPRPAAPRGLRQHRQPQPGLVQAPTSTRTSRSRSNMKIWFAWVAKYDSVYHLGTTEAKVEKLWYKTQADLYSQPGRRCRRRQ